jgi:ATP-binding cassette subfamily G (WHITE) protein 2 (SNQ2)
MFYTQYDRMYQENADGRDGTRVPVPLHNCDENGERPHQPEDRSSTSRSDRNNDRAWGEHDIGGPVNLRNGMAD